MSRNVDLALRAVDIVKRRLNVNTRQQKKCMRKAARQGGGSDAMRRLNQRLFIIALRKKYLLKKLSMAKLKVANLTGAH